MENNKLSIITINYNNVEGLKRTIESVSSQTYREIEHIIIDAASIDGSVDIVREYESVNHSSAHPLNIVWSSERDDGIYAGMNKGIRKATGDYVQILNSGDILAADDVTERMMVALQRVNSKELRVNNKGVGILYGNMMKAYRDGRFVRDNCGGPGATESFFYFYKGTLNHDCAYIRRDLFEKYGLYNEQMKICSDWEWYVRVIVLGGETPIYTNIDVTIFDMNGISESGGKNLELIKKERRMYLESILPIAVLEDYDKYYTYIIMLRRLCRHPWAFRIVRMFERIIFKLEKWGVLHN